MTPAERKTLEYLVTNGTGPVPFDSDDKDAIRSALAEIDRLTAERDEALARAIPARWVERATAGGELVLSLNETGGGWVEVVRTHGAKRHPLACGAYWTRRESDGMSETGCDTLAAALAAAAKESP